MRVIFHLRPYPLASRTSRSHKLNNRGSTNKKMVKDLNTIFVSGVPGHIGTELVKILSDRKVNVKVLVHKRPHEMLDDLPGVGFLPVT